MNVLSTARLTLRRMGREDLDFVAAMLGDAEVMRFYPKVYDRDEAAAWVERMLLRYEKDGHGLWLACDRATGEPRGQVGVLTQDVEGRSLIEVGYLIHRPYWRQGLASEAAAGCRDWAFANLPTAAVHSLIRPENVPSQGVARTMGMVPEPKPVDFRGIVHQVWKVRRAEAAQDPG